MPSISSLGIGSGLDLEGLVNQLVAAEGSADSLRLDQQEALYQAELSGLGVFRSALDGFASTLVALKDSATFGARTVSSGNTELFTASASGAAFDGNYDVEVLQLAQVQKLRSNPFVHADPELSNADTEVGTGTLTISVGGESIDIVIDEESSSLTQIADAINAAEDNPGVSASVVSGDDGAYLVLAGTNTGTEGEMTITVADATGNLDQLAYDPANSIANLNELEAAQDAQVSIDGIVVTSATNQITDAVSGVTLDLVSAEPGTTASLGVSLDVAGTREKIEAFVNSYNSMIDSIAGLTGFDAETGTSGILQGDNLGPLFLSQIRSELGSVVDTGVEGFSLLSQIGISTDPESGRLQIDAEVAGLSAQFTLDEALRENFDAFDELFSSEDGIATKADALVNVYLKADGLLDNRVEGVNSSLESVAEQRDDLEDRLISFEERTRAEFIALDLLVSQLTATSNFLTTQLATLSGSNSNN